MGIKELKENIELFTDFNFGLVCFMGSIFLLFCIIRLVLS